MQFRHNTVLITGGAGSIGLALARGLLNFKPHAIRLFDNNEHCLAVAKRQLNGESDRFRYLLGDVRDANRLEMAFSGVNMVYHLAAVKHIDISAYNPTEVLATNIDGTMNVIRTCLKTKPDNAILVSTDKAVYPSSTYGMSKALSERLFLWANNISDHTRFSVVRFGNVRQSSGNVFEIWNEQKKAGKPLTVTDEEATRYFMDIKDAVDFVLNASIYAAGGEIFVADMPKHKIIDLAKEISEDIEVTGLRVDEKLHEELMTAGERARAEYFADKYWIIRNTDNL